MKPPQNAMDIAYYLILAAIVVLIIMNASKFKTAVDSVGGQSVNVLKTVSGSNYGK